jgi:hypothetical protein
VSIVQPRIADIATSEILFYDAACVTDCYRFCLKRDIDCLPAISDQSAFHRRNDNTQAFDGEDLGNDRRLEAHIAIFRPELLERFQGQPVQFIFTHDELTGVVHFSDYNRPVVSTFLYDAIAGYERSLRALLKESGHTHADMLAYLEAMAEATLGTDDHSCYKGRGKKLLKKAKRMPQAPPFQVFELRDLIGLSEAKDIMGLDSDVVELRNMVMHTNRLVDMVDEQTDDFIYDFASFERFFGRVLSLLEDSQRVKNRLAFIRGLEEIGKGD